LLSKTSTKYIFDETTSKEYITSSLSHVLNEITSIGTGDSAFDGNGAILAGDWQNVLLPETTKFPRSPSLTPAPGPDFPCPRPRTGISYPMGPQSLIVPRDAELSSSQMVVGQVLPGGGSYSNPSSSASVSLEVG
jgi:hypothetical protein